MSAITFETPGDRVQWPDLSPGPLSFFAVASSTRSPSLLMQVTREKPGMTFRVPCPIPLLIAGSGSGAVTVSILPLREKTSFPSRFVVVISTVFPHGCDNRCVCFYFQWFFLIILSCLPGRNMPDQASPILPLAENVVWPCTSKHMAVMCFRRFAPRVTVQRKVTGRKGIPDPSISFMTSTTPSLKNPFKYKP